jgi:hypothetical protein
MGHAGKGIHRRKTARRRAGKARKESIFAVRSRDIAGVVYTYNVLMRIHIYLEAILFAFPQYANSVVHKVMVIDPTGGLSVRV